MQIALYNPEINKFYNVAKKEYFDSMFVRLNDMYIPKATIYNDVDEAKKIKENYPELILVQLTIKPVIHDS